MIGDIFEAFSSAVPMIISALYLYWEHCTSNGFCPVIFKVGWLESSWSHVSCAKKFHVQFSFWRHAGLRNLIFQQPFSVSYHFPFKSLCCPRCSLPSGSLSWRTSWLATTPRWTSPPSCERPSSTSGSYRCLETLMIEFTNRPCAGLLLIVIHGKESSLPRYFNATLWRTGVKRFLLKPSTEAPPKR